MPARYCAMNRKYLKSQFLISFRPPKQVCLHKARINKTNGEAVLRYIFITLVSLTVVTLIVSTIASPLINDITTSRLPELRFKQQDSFNERSWQLQQEYYPKVKPLMLPDSPLVVFSHVIQHAKNCFQWRIDSSSNFLLKATAKTKYLNFKDDVIVFVENKSLKLGSMVHMRSRSRTGKSDFGVNTARIKSFFATLKTGICPQKNR